MTYPAIKQNADFAGYALSSKLFSDEQARTLINLEQRYEVWIEATRLLWRLPYDMRRKSIGNRFYLYEISDRRGNGHSLGRWTAEQASRLAEYRACKATARHRQRVSKAMLDASCAMARALRLPFLARTTGAILREADRRGLLGDRLIVLGVAAMAAYAGEAGSIFRNLSFETGTLALAWIGDDLQDGVQTIRDLLTAVDPTFSVDPDLPARSCNAKGYEVDILYIASSRTAAERVVLSDPVLSSDLEWLAQGRLVSRVLVCRDGSPARIVAPDPRRFALHAMSMVSCPEHHTQGRSADRRPGLLLLDMIVEVMPHYPLDEAFLAQMPHDLAAYLTGRRDMPPGSSTSAW